MNPEHQRIAIAEACGWVWYRLPIQRSDNRVYRCLFLPALHEYDGQSKAWLVRADGTERICNMEYMALEGRVPDYLDDLNAMHEAEKLLTEKQQVWYLQKLTQVRLTAGVCGMIACMTDKTTFATAAQRAEALLRTIGKWRESRP